MRGNKQQVPLMAEEFTSAIQRCGLPLKLDEATPGDGNCWVRAVVQQLERPEMRQQLNERTREILNVRKSERHLVLKSRIAEFATTSRHPNILEIKEAFRREGQGQVDNISWEDHWKGLKKDKEWSDEVMVQATAWFTEIDIQVVWTTGMPEEPFKTIGGNMDDRAKDCPGFPMWIGYKNSIHYQSLLPNNEKFPTRGRAGERKIKKHRKDALPKKNSQGIKSLKRKQAKRIKSQGIKSSRTKSKKRKIVEMRNSKGQVRKGSTRVKQQNQQRW